MTGLVRNLALQELTRTFISFSGVHRGFRSGRKSGMEEIDWQS